MSETTQTIEQPKVEQKVSGLDLLSQDRRFLDSDAPIVAPTEPVKTEAQIADDKAKATLEAEIKTPIIEPSQTEKEAKLAEIKDLGLAETATETEIAAAKEAKLNAPKEDEWTVTEVEQSIKEEEGNGWKNLAATLAEKTGNELPPDFADTEDAYLDYQVKLIKDAEEKASQYSIETELSKLTPEARLVIDLNKAGVTLEEYQAPFIEVQNLKAMSDEALIRMKYENKKGWDKDMVDRKVEEIIEEGKSEIEAKIIRDDLNNYEQTIQDQHKQKLNQYTEQQKQVQQQARQKESAFIKHELDKVTTYMDRKLGDDVKAILHNELTSGKYDNMPGTPAEKVGYALYRKFGEQGIKYMKDRVLEQLTKEKLQTQHNTPSVSGGPANRTQHVSTKQGLDKLEEDPRFNQ